MAAAQDRQLQLASTAWSPFTNAPGQARFALDLVGAALERVGVVAETVIVDEARLTPALLSGEFDGSAALWRDAERERALIYSQPYLENRLILVGRQGSDVSATSLADLAGKRIALVAGYAYGEAVETTDGPIFVGANSREDSVARLLNGEVDYTLMDDLVIQYLISHHAEEARTRLAFGSTPLLTRSLHFAVRRSLPDAESIISRFNAGLRGMIADGSYHSLLHLDWIQAGRRRRRSQGVRASRRSNRPAPAAAFLRALRDGGQSDCGARRDAALLPRRQHLRGLVHRARASTRSRTSADPSGVDTRSESQLHVVAGARPLQPGALCRHAATCATRRGTSTSCPVAGYRAEAVGRRPRAAAPALPASAACGSVRPRPDRGWPGPSRG